MSKREGEPLEKSEILRRRRGSGENVRMAYVSPNEIVRTFGPQRFPDTHSNIIKHIVTQALKHIGANEDVIRKAARDIEEAKPKIDWEDLDNIWFGQGGIQDKEFDPKHPFSWVQQYIHPTTEDSDIFHDRSMASIANLGKQFAGVQQTPLTNAEDIEAELATVSKGVGEISRLLSSNDNSLVGDPLHVCALTHALTRMHYMISTVTDEAAKALFRKTDANTGLTQALQIIDIDPKPVTRSYMQEFMRAPVVTNPLERKCVRGADCFMMHMKTNANFRCFYRPSVWEEICEKGVLPQVDTMCIMCTIIIVNIYHALCMQHNLKNVPMQLTDFTFDVGDGPNQFSSSYMIPVLGYGLSQPFLSASAGHYTTSRRSVKYIGNTFILPCLEFANFQ